MDILAARKKAAEQAKAGQAHSEKAPAGPEHGEAVTPAEEARPSGTSVASAAAEAGTEGTPLPLPEAPEAGPASGAATAPSSQAAAESQEPQEEQELEMLVFRLGNEEYAVPVDLVGEILTPREITAVPHAPAYIMGVCSLRGMVLPIVDLNRRLGLAESVRDEKSRIIVVVLGSDDRVGLVVDRVRGVVRIAPSSVRPAPETIDAGAGAAFLQGIARKDDRLYILLDAEKAVG